MEKTQSKKEELIVDASKITEVDVHYFHQGFFSLLKDVDDETFSEILKCFARKVKPENLKNKLLFHIETPENFLVRGKLMAYKNFKAYEDRHHRVPNIVAASSLLKRKELPDLVKDLRKEMKEQDLAKWLELRDKELAKRMRGFKFTPKVLIITTLPIS